MVGGHKKASGESRTARYRYLVYLMVFCVMIINYWDRAVLSVALPLLRRDFDMTPVTAGYLLSAFLLTYGILQLPAGMLLDRLGSRRAGAVALALWSAATAAAGAATGFVSLFATRLAVGVGESVSMPLSGRTVREWAPVRERAAAQAFVHSGLPFGTAVASVVVGGMVGIFGWRIAFVLSGMLGLVWALVWFACYDTPQRSRRLGGDERRLIEAGRPPRQAASRGGTLADLGLLLRSRTVWGLFLTQGCVNYANYFLLNWLPSYFVEAYGIDIMHSGQATGVVYISAAVLMVLLGMASDALLRGRRVEHGARRHVVAIVALAGSVIGLAPFVASQAGQLMLMALSTGCILSVFANNVSLVNDLLPDDRYIGAAIGWVQFGGQVFGLAAPIVTGYLVSRTGGYVAAFVTSGAFLLAGALACETMTRKPVVLPTVQAPALVGG